MNTKFTFDSVKEEYVSNKIVYEMGIEQSDHFKNLQKYKHFEVVKLSMASISTIFTVTFIEFSWILQAA